MIRLVFAAILAALPLLLLQSPARAQTEQQSLVDRATLTVQDMLNDSTNREARKLLRNAKGVMVCPRVFKAGFILGGEGGSCVMVGRTGDSWSSPAFYGMGSGSVGFQIGVQDSQIIFLVLTDKGLRALMDSQFKFGGDASVAVATIGAGVQGSTTTALRADIVAFAQTRGLFAGVSLEGTLLSQRSEWNQVYYGQAFSPQQIVLNGQGQNPGSEPLKDMLNRMSAQ